MKIMGYVWLLAGWLIVVAAVVLLSVERARVIFLSAGFVLESLGLGLMVRAHAVERKREREL